MSIAYTDLETRISRELRLLGAFQSATATDILKDALTEFCRLADPEISANLSVVDGTQLYDYPATIKKIHALYDDSSPVEDVVYTDIAYKRQIYLQEDPDETATYVIYGTPYNVRTNYQTIIAGLDEEWADCLWQMVRAHCAKQARDDSWVSEYNLAKQLIRDERESQNRNEDVSDQTVQVLDRKGYRVDDTSNAEGLDADYSDHLEIDVG